MVKIADLKGNDHPSGLDAMRKFVHKRLAAAGVNDSDAFDSGESLDYLCRMSGGHLRNLLILIRGAARHPGRCR
jgi:hypothetical protein